MKQNCCANCKHWAGDESAYSADCGLNILTRPPFHAVCKSHEARPSDTIGAVVADIAMQSTTRGVYLWPSAGSAGSPHNPPCPQCGSNAYVRRVGQEWFCGACCKYWK